MMPLSPFTLPLPTNGPPDGFDWAGRHEVSITTAFDTGIDRRDIFHGLPRCVICGTHFRPFLQRCHIIAQAERAVVS